MRLSERKHGRELQAYKAEHLKSCSLRVHLKSCSLRVAQRTTVVNIEPTKRSRRIFAATTQDSCPQVPTTQLPAAVQRSPIRVCHCTLHQLEEKWQAQTEKVKMVGSWRNNRKR
ncbi:uncharacterized protein [Aegilops tauschii subsp. strangulata]|uniref:uncharacterized protein isoform X2 n=1 Tax=Aegilops tauschii subsp. strangulata TaxID=200361 RepID=UPI003CC8E12A